MSLTEFLAKEYDPVRYNCTHFAWEFWKYLTGEDISCFLLKDEHDAEEIRTGYKRRIESPESPCVVFMRSQVEPLHVGIFIDGNILHMTEQGVVNQRLTLLEPHYQMTFFK